MRLLVNGKNNLTDEHLLYKPLYPLVYILEYIVFNHILKELNSPIKTTLLITFNFAQK